MTLINGVAADHIDVQDRGLHYGDGVFTTLRVRDGEPALWEQHMQRLARDCARLNIAAPDPATLRTEATRVCVNAAQAVLKIIVTRGSGGRGYQPPRESTPTRIVKLYPWPDHPEQNWTHGIALRVNATRLGRNLMLAGIKHLNRLEQVLARAEWNDPAIAEGLMLDEQGHAVEATAANLFVVRNNVLLTPTLVNCGVSGVLRGEVMDIAQTLGIAAQECELELKDVLAADEIFVTNSVIGIWPVREFDSTVKQIGPLTRRIIAELARRTPAYA